MTKQATIKLFNDQYNLKNINLNSFEFTSDVEFHSKQKQAFVGKPRSIWKDILIRFFKNKWNALFTIVILALVLLIIFGPYMSRFSAYEKTGSGTNEVIALAKPSWVKDWNHVTRNFDITEYWDYYNHDNYGLFDAQDVLSRTDVTDSSGQVSQFRVEYINKFAPKTILGTDTVGRDVWARLFVGARWSFELAIFVATVETIIGVSLGIYIGYHVGSKIDTLSMRLIEIFQSVPGLIWIFIFSLLLGTSFFSIVLVLVFVGWVSPLYSARMFTLKIKDAEFIKTAESIGVSKLGRLFKHILPNIIGRLLVGFVHRIPGVIFIETTLKFLGMDVGGPNGLSIGNLISDARGLEAIELNIYYALSISLFLLLFSISLQVIANGIRDAFDPKTGGR